MNRRRAAAWFAVVGIVSGAAGLGLYLGLRDSGDPAIEAAADPRKVAKAVLAARLADPQGAERTVGEWRGRVLVVNFWATWCAPCREEIPVFVRMQERYGSRGLQFIGIAIDQPDKVASFAREFGINYPLLLGSLETMQLVRMAGNRAGVLPYTLVLDRAGNLVSRELGGLKEARLDSLIRPLF